LQRGGVVVSSASEERGGAIETNVIKAPSSRRKGLGKFPSSRRKGLGRLGQREHLLSADLLLCKRKIYADTGGTPRQLLSSCLPVGGRLVRGMRFADNTEVGVILYGQLANQMESGAPRRSAISPRGVCLLA